MFSLPELLRSLAYVEWFLALTYKLRLKPFPVAPQAMGIQSVQNRDANSTHCQPRHMPRQFRIEPHDTIGAKREISRVEDRGFDEVQDGSIAGAVTVGFRFVIDFMRRLVAQIFSPCRP